MLMKLTTVAAAATTCPFAQSISLAATKIAQRQKGFLRQS